MADVFKEFKEFISRGNVVDLAVAVVIGAAFTAIVTAVVEGLITPLIGMIGGKDFRQMTFEINDSVFSYGIVINAIIYFVSVAAVVFFFVVRPLNQLMSRFKPEPALDQPTRACPECLSDIPYAARRCAFCTTEVSPVP